jgi:phosphate transport system substrate-binding protein
MVSSVAAFRKVAVASVAATALFVSPLFSAIAQAASINGAGATFPELLYKKYSQEYQKKTNNQVNYQAVGSGAGIRQVIAGVVQFGGSDAAMTDDQMKDGEAGKRGILLIPTAGGAVVPVFNVSGVSNLKLSKSALAGIFSGKITKWNDDAIAKENSGVKLPGDSIKPIVRADGSGTTFIFTNHLSAVDAYFKGRVGVGTAPKWSNNPLKERGNAGVSSGVKRTPNSIGYVEYAFAKSNGLSIADVQDAGGNFVQPNIGNINEAIGSIQLPDNFRAFVGEPSKGYPIVGLTWMMVYKKYATAQQANDVKSWMKWVLTDGQAINNSLDFSQMNSDTVNRALQAVETISAQ